MRVVVAITGGSGVIYAIKTLEVMQSLKIEAHLIVSRWGERNIAIETDKTFDYVKSLARTYYNNDNMAAATSSGSFKYDGMLIVPCSMKTLSSVANGYEDSLISRSAGVCIKESRRLVINDEEARLLCKTTNLIKCAKLIMSWGPWFVIVKKGEHGCLFINGDTLFPAPAYPMEEIVDPTGAGDSFAGGFMGHIARKNSVNLNTMKEAVIYGNVMGAFAVEGFGVEKLLSIAKQDVEKRYETYRDIVKF